MDRFFLFDPEGEGFVTFETREQQTAAARRAIDSYRDYEWDLAVDAIVCGVITEQSIKYDAISRPAESKIDASGLDEDGNFWLTGNDEICDYKMSSIKGGKDET